MDFEIRGDRRPQGPGKPSREREAHSRFVQQGYSDTEASRIVGIDRSTGNKWRNAPLSEHATRCLMLLYLPAIKTPRPSLPR